MWTRENYRRLFDKLGVVYETYKSGLINRKVLRYKGQSLEMYLNVLQGGFLYFASNVAFHDTFDPKLWDFVPTGAMQKKDQDDPSIEGWVPKLGSEQQAFVDMLSKR